MREIENIKNNGKWHLSKYNIFSTKIIENKKLPCVNLLKGTYSELDIEDIRKLYHLEDISNIEEELQGFIRQGIIVNFDELTYLQTRSLLEFHGNGGLGITIVTTMQCNFNCPYCFESHVNNSKMSLEIQDKTFNFIKNLLEMTGSRRLTINWYGGEPLLAFDVIENLSQKIIKYTEEKKIKYIAHIITNGYLLNQEKIDILEKNKVNSIQITLDGSKENHDKTRCLINGDPTFDKIINNLYNIKFSGNINIRHNIYKKNIKDSEELQQIISDIKLKTKNKIKYYQAVVINNPAELRKNQVEFLDKKFICQIEANRDAEKFSPGKPFFCGAQNLWFLVIGSDGKLYKCWEDVGKEDRFFATIEQLNPRNFINTSCNLNALLLYVNSISVLNDEECKQCVWLPLCSGGCPSKKMFHNMKCISFKDDPDYFIEKVKEYTIEKMISVKNN